MPTPPQSVVVPIPSFRCPGSRLRQEERIQTRPGRGAFLALTVMLPLLGWQIPLGAATQVCRLTQGWNWVSFQVEPPATGLVDVLAPLQSQVTAAKNQTRSATRQDGRWVGDLTDMSGIGRGEMFKLQAVSSCDLTIAGDRIAEEMEIPLASGWNWVAFLPGAEMPLDTALVSVSGLAEAVKSQTGSAVQVTGHWMGDLQHLEPGLGYALRVSGPATLQYPASPTRPWVYVYHPCYQWYDLGDSGIPWRDITHLCLGYMLLTPNAAGQWTIEVPSGFYPGPAAWRQQARDWVDEGRGHNRVVTCMLGGEGSNTGTSHRFWNTATSPANVAAFARNIQAVLQPLGFAGMDLDWEEDVDPAGFLRLVQELRAVWPEALITIPTAFNGGDAQALAPLREYVDAFMPMSYLSIDQWGGWRVPVPLTPLYAFAGNPYSSRLTLDRWLQAGVPASKIVMGVGGYGAVWGDSNGDGRAPIAPYISSLTGLAEGEAGAMYTDNLISQAWVEQAIASHPGWVAGWDDIGRCAYWSAPAPNQLIRSYFDGWPYHVDAGLIFYETPRSIGEKVTFIQDNDMKGMMFWTLSMLQGAAGTFPNLAAAAGRPLDARPPEP